MKPFPYSKRSSRIYFWQAFFPPFPHTSAFALGLTAVLCETQYQVLHIFSLSSEFESLAVKLLDSCYIDDEDLAQSLIVRALEPFGWLTCMDIAQLAEDQNFIAHSSCQILFNRLWMGGIILDTPWWKVTFFLEKRTTVQAKY